MHGNGFLTRYDVEEVAVVPHRHHPVDWESPAHPLAQREPRRGRRVSLRATFRTAVGCVDCYTAHLEVFCGALSRLRQFADLLCDARRRVRAHPVVRAPRSAALCLDVDRDRTSRATPKWWGGSAHTTRLCTLAHDEPRRRTDLVVSED